MLTSLAFFLLPVIASAQLDPSASYAVNKDLKDAGPSYKMPDAYETSTVTDFSSFDQNDKSGEPMISSHTEQVMKAKKLQKAEKKDAKAEARERIEMSFERFATSSRVKVFSLARPFETHTDLGSALSGLGLIVSPGEKGGTKFENIDQVRRDALARATDATSRMAISTLFNESLLGKVGMPGQDSGCLGSLHGKKPGDHWKTTGGNAEVKLSVDCSFEGWSDAGGKKLAVVKLHIPKQKTTVRQPNGVPGVTETESDATVYLDSASSETAMKMVTHITAEPAEAELARLKAQGRTPPRNRSEMTLLVRTHEIEGQRKSPEAASSPGAP